MSLRAPLQRRLDELKVEVRLGTEAIHIERSAGRATGVTVRDTGGLECTLEADYVVSNMEVIPAAEHLLKQTPGIEKAGPVRAGLLWDRGASGPQSHLSAARPP